MNKQHDLATAKAEDVSGLALSSSHLVKLGVLAMIGTGIFAALDVGHGRTDFGQTAPSAARVESGGAVITISEPEPERFSKAETRSLAEPAADASSTSSLSAAPRSVPPSGTIPAPETSTLSVQAANVLGRPGATTLEPEAPVKEEAQTASASATTFPSNVARDATRATAGVLRDCDLSELNAVLADVTARFGTVTVVAGHQSKMVNHMSGSPREKLHHDCKAIDFRPEPTRLNEIKAYMRSRPDISGIESYRDGVIHIDIGPALVATRHPSTSAAQTQGRKTAQVAQELPKMAQTLVVSGRDHEHRDN